MLVRYKLLHPAAKAPVYGSAEAAGADLHAIGYHLIKPGNYKLIPTGLAIELAPGTEAQCRPRSGMAAKHGISIVNSPGTIDSDYRGEIKVILINHGSEDFAVNNGDRIAQLVIAPVLRGVFAPVGDEQLSETKRGEGGFGSTGVGHLPASNPFASLAE
ncbi:MAG: dUTP diphosphatase [Mesorhizobium sp.]|nr:MAG: dUTP diphosphatase [Mesorhizobium sp.]